MNKTPPRAEIEKFMKSLDISEQEAIDLWLEDNGLKEECEEVKELTAKAKANKTDKIVVQSKINKAKTERKPKENPLKSSIIQYLYKILAQNPSLLALKVENPTKTIDFIAEGKYFSLNLVEHRPKKQ